MDNVEKATLAGCIEIVASFFMQGGFIISLGVLCNTDG